MNSKNTSLLIAVYSLAFISGLTTFLGVQVIISSASQIVKFTIAFGIALGTSAMMIHFGRRIQEFALQRKLIQMLGAYLLVAMVSIFFNYASFYTYLVTSDTASGEFSQLKSKVGDGLQIAKEIPGRVSKTNDLRKVIATSKDGMRFELDKSRNSNIGKGDRYKEHEKTYATSVPKLEAAKIDSVRLSIRIQKGLSGIRERAENIFAEYDNGRYSDEWLIEKRGVLEGLFDELYSVIRTFDPSIEKPVFSSAMRINSSERALDALLSFIFGNVDNSDRNKVYTALGLGIVLDVPIFIALLLLGKFETESSDKPTSRVAHFDKKNQGEQKRKPFEERKKGNKTKGEGGPYSKYFK